MADEPVIDLSAELAEAYPDQLVPVQTEELVRRYNQCLAEIGLPETELASFSIDGSGWSPEISVERGDPLYLFHGEANPFGIVLTPRQKGRILCFPPFSFCPTLMEMLFYHYGPGVQEVTRQTGIWLDFDEDLSHYRTPLDLLLIDSIHVRVFAGNGIIAVANGQEALMERFLNDGAAWFEEELRREIMEHVRRHGDLRSKDLAVPGVPFRGVDTFHSVAFGGVFVFRDRDGRERPLLVLENPEQIPQIDAGDARMHSIEDPVLPEILQLWGLVDVAPVYFAQRLDVLETLADGMLSQALGESDPELCYAELNAAQKKQTTRQLSSRLPEAFFGIERLIKQLQSGAAPDPKSLPADLHRCLMHPREDLPELTRRVVWQLIGRCVPGHLALRHRFTPRQFAAEYHTWPSGQRRFALHLSRRLARYQ